MAYVNSTRTSSNGLADRAAALIKSVKTALNQRRIYAQTVRELNQLSDRELADLGMHQSMIADVAREAAYGK